MRFAPLDRDGERRAALHRAARLLLLHERVIKRLDQIDEGADLVVKAAAELIDAVLAEPGRSIRLPKATWTLGL
jgi:hypothetical protein